MWPTACWWGGQWVCYIWCGNTYPGDVEEVEASVAEEIHCWILADLKTVFEVDLTDVSTPTW